MPNNPIVVTYKNQRGRSETVKYKPSQTRIDKAQKLVQKDKHPDSAFFREGGCVYLIQMVRVPGLFKIGHTTDLSSRLIALQIGSPFRLDVAAQIMCGPLGSSDNGWTSSNGAELEKKLHKFYSAFRIRGEWFSLGLREFSDLKTVLDRDGRWIDLRKPVFSIHDAAELAEKERTEQGVQLTDIKPNDHTNLNV